MKTLSDLIAEKKLDWVNPDIEKHFTATAVPEDTEYKLFHFDRDISSKDAIEEIKHAGWRAANISELLSWCDWNWKDLVVALGSVAEVRGDRSVPVLYEDDSERFLYLDWFGGYWAARYRFLAVRNSRVPGTSDSSPSDSLTLELEEAIRKCKAAGYQVIKML